MRHPVLFACAMLVCLSSLTWGQTAGTSSGGSLWGKVTDESGAIVPGVTVTVGGPSLMGVQTTVTNEQGIYRFPALPPGDFKVTFTLSGFNTLVREGIHLTLAFTATVDVQLKISTVAETVQVVGESPVVDAVNTRIQTSYSKEVLASIPSARDMWAVLGTAPSVEMARIDVGGSTAGTQTTYRAYGVNGQTKPLIEGIIGLESNNSVGFYYDYGSFDEVSVTAAGQGADMANPGIQSIFISKSGGNTFHGDFYTDYENKSLQGHDISGDQITKWKLSPESNRVFKNQDLNFGGGGYAIKDKLWWYGSFRHQDIEFNYPQLPSTVPFVTTITDFTGKITYNLPKNNRLVGYVMMGIKKQPYRLDSFQLANTDINPNTNSTWNQWNPGWVWKVEWNKTFGNAMFIEARVGQWFDDWHQTSYTDQPRVEDISANTVWGGNRNWTAHQNRPQTTGSMSYYKDGWHGSHNFRLGWEIQLDDRREFWYDAYPGNNVSILSNAVPTQVYFLASGLDSDSRLYWDSIYLTDTWTMNHLSVNAGVRYDYYKSAYPDQSRPASTPLGYSTTVFPAIDVQAQDLVAWNSFAPRVGISWDMTGKSKNVLKASYGRYYWNPTRDISNAVNPNNVPQWRRYGWTDLNKNGYWDPGEEGSLQATRGGVANQVLDPTVKDPRTDQITTSFERQLGDKFGMHVAYVMNHTSDRYQARNILTPASAYTIPLTMPDPGPDGIVGTADDGAALQLLNLNPSLLGQTLTSTVTVPNYTETAHTFELAANRRFSNRWSLNASYAMTWRNNFNTIPYSPNDVAQGDMVRMTFAKVTMSYEPGWGIRVTPVMRYQSGTPFGRQVNVKVNYGTQTVQLEPTGAERMDSPLLFDCRAERRFTIFKGKLSVVMDAFNITNSNAVTSLNTVSGPNFLQPITILNPRVVRFGLKFSF